VKDVDFFVPNECLASTTERLQLLLNFPAVEHCPRTSRRHHHWKFLRSAPRLVSQIVPSSQFSISCTAIFITLDPFFAYSHCWWIFGLKFSILFSHMVTVSFDATIVSVARKKSLFDDKSDDIQQLTLVIKQDISTLNRQIGQLQEVSIYFCRGLYIVAFIFTY